MARYNGMGWHKQSIRHSNARKYGHAGGTYAMRYEKSGFFKGEPILVKQTNNPSRVEIYSKHTGKGFADKKHIMRTTSKKHYGSSYELEPRYDSRKSFYGKARVEIEDGNKKLYSYNTLVAEIKDGRAIVHGTYSQTTLRHIKDFLKQEGFKADNSKQILKDYPEKPKVLKVMSNDEAEKLYEYELENGIINTESTPHYNSFVDYKRMLRDMGIEIKEE